MQPTEEFLNSCESSYQLADAIPIFVTFSIFHRITDGTESVKIVLTLALCVACGVSIGILRAAWHFGLLGTSRVTSPFEYPPESDDDFWQLPPDGPQPKLSLDSLAHDFGVMEVETEGRHVFIFRNTGDYPLLLRRGKTTCKCTLANLDDEAIPPGGSAQVTLEWTAITPSGVWTNLFRQRASIHTNDPRRPTVDLVITGTLTMPIRSLPTDLALQDLAQRQTKTVDLRVYGFRDAPLEILGHKFVSVETSKYFTIRMEPLSGKELSAESAKSGYRLSVTLKPGLPLGPFQQTIRLHTNYADVPTVDIPVTGQIVGNCIVSGAGYSRRTGILSIPKVSGRKGMRRELSVIVYGADNSGSAVRVTQTTPPAMIATLGKPSPHDNGQAIRIPLTIEIPVNTPPMKFPGPLASQLGEITIETGFDEMSELKIRVKFVVE